MATYRVPLLYHLTIHVLYRPVPQNLLYLPWGSWHWRAWSLEAGWWACFISNKRIDTHLASSPLTGVEVRSRLLYSPAAGHTTSIASWSPSSVSPSLSPLTSSPARPEPPTCHPRAPTTDGATAHDALAAARRHAHPARPSSSLPAAETKGRYRLIPLHVECKNQLAVPAHLGLSRTQA